MAVLQDLGNTIAEYAGNGQGEVEPESVVEMTDIDDLGVYDIDSVVYDISMERSEKSGNDAQPLLFLYDCETTGFSIYNDHIIEVAAMLVNCPVAYSNDTFSSLVKTSRRIPAAGKRLRIIPHFLSFDFQFSRQSYKYHTHYDPW